MFNGFFVSFNLKLFVFLIVMFLGISLNNYGPPMYDRVVGTKLALSFPIRDDTFLSSFNVNQLSVPIRLSWLASA